jgi:hypothetical protein
MNLLLLIYAMIAGLTGFNAGPSAIARMAAVAETGSLSTLGEATDQVTIATKAMAARVVEPARIPDATLPDVRRVAISLPARAIVTFGRAAPERRLE